MLISNTKGMSLRVIPPMLLQIAYLIAKGKGYYSCLTRLEIAIKI